MYIYGMTIFLGEKYTKPCCLVYQSYQVLPSTTISTTISPVETKMNCILIIHNVVC